MASSPMTRQLKDRQFTAVLFDIGGPIDTEVLFEQECDRLIGEAFAALGHPISVDEVARASSVAVLARAPNAYIAMIEHLAGDDTALAAAVTTKFRTDLVTLDLFEQRDGIEGVLRWLHGRGLKLGIVANQPQRKIDAMRRAGLAGYFADLQMSEGIGLRKPDPAIFRHVCRALGMEPALCIMVGDRVDNDIAPAKRLGMATIRVLTGRHRDQPMLTDDDTADFAVKDCDGLRVALEAMLS